MPGPTQAITELLQRHIGAAVSEDSLQLIATGASGRSIMRSTCPQTRGLLGIYWTNDRADNASFVPAARGLAEAGVQVPAILAETNLGNGKGACLVQDLGSSDLLSLKGAPWVEIRQAYTQALQTVIALHRVKPNWELQPAFDEAMYRWEQSYFAEHLVGQHLGKSAAKFLAHPALQNMAAHLASLPRVPIHRDFQSQNVMLHNGQAWLIDFQGMREGRPEYDIASLIYDPYMDFSEQQSDELLEIYAQLNGNAPQADIMSACAMQRLMQALGAFANIGYNQKRDWYLNLIPTGLRKLRQIAARVPVGSPCQDVAQWLLNVI